MPLPIPEQTPVRVVTNYYQGKALRAQTAATEKATELADDKMKMEQDREARLQGAQDLDLQKFEIEIREKSAAASLEAYERADGTEDEKKVAAFEAGISVLDEYLPGGREDVFAFLKENGQEFGPDQFDPEEARAILADPKTYQEIQKKKAAEKPSLQNFGTADGEITETHIVGSEGYNEAVEKGLHAIGPVTQVQKTADVTDQLSGASDDKTMARNIREVMGATDNLMYGLNRIDELVKKAPQTALGLPGNVSEYIDRTVESVKGFTAIAGGWAEINNTKVPEEALLDVRLYEDKFSGASATNAAIQSNAVGIAYALARAANPDGRLSDADVRSQLDRLELDQSSKTRISASINEVRRSQLSSAINWLRTSGATKTEEGRAAFSRYEKMLARMDPGPDSETVEDFDDGTRIVWQ